MLSAEEAARLLLSYVVVPLWIAAGFADWLCHRYTRIATTAGPRESWLHLLMFAELGVPLLLVLFYDVNALLFAIMLVALALHQLTVWWDLRFAMAHRRINPVEQMVHSLLEMMPLAAVLLLAVLHFGQFQALFGLGDETARLGLNARHPPLDAGYVASLLAAVAVFNALPYLEELSRGRRAQRMRVAG